MAERQIFSSAVFEQRMDQLGMSRRELLEIVPISEGHLSRILSGRNVPGIEIATQLANAVNLPMSALFDNAESMSKLKIIDCFIGQSIADCLPKTRPLQIETFCTNEEIWRRISKASAMSLSLVNGLSESAREEILSSILPSMGIEDGAHTYICYSSISRMEDSVVIVKPALFASAVRLIRK